MGLDAKCIISILGVLRKTLFCIAYTVYMLEQADLQLELRLHN